MNDAVPTMLSLGSDDYDSILTAFQWDIPSSFNVANAVCTRHADGQKRLALITENESGESARYSFDDIEDLSLRLASAFRALGVERGDRVAVVLPQRLETALVHLAAHHLGAISLPLSVLFGDEALQYRLIDSGSKLVVTDSSHAELIDSFRHELPELVTLLEVVADAPTTMETLEFLPANDLHSGIVTNDKARTKENFWQLLSSSAPLESPVSTSADDPAFLLYTSGTTGPPKGALIAHRSLMGNLTGFEASHNGFPVADDIVYTPADWAWTGGLLDGLLPAWYYGVPVVAYDSKKFQPDAIMSLMSRHKVTCAFIPPTALKMLRSKADIFDTYKLSLRSVMSAGETVGEELFTWGRETLGIEINEMCGQTEHNYLIGNCSAQLPVKPGSMGKAYPGHRVAILGNDGTLLDDGKVGQIVAHRDDPVHFLGYWNKPDATRKKYTGDWFHTGDVGYRDTDGYLWFVGRDDDVISSAGYRIGPGEIENCALSHPAVLQVAAIGVPDPDGIRGDIVKLCVVLRAGENPSASLESSLGQHVRRHLAAYEYPRLIEFMDALPLTTTGKVRRNILREWHEGKDSDD